MKLGKALDKYLRNTGIKTLVSSEDLWREWAALVGEDIALHTRISRLSKGVLTVDVSSSALLSELKNYLHDSLLSGLRERLKRPIHSIRFRLADLPGIEEISNAGIPEK